MIIDSVPWDVEVSDEFAEWYGALDEDESESVDTAVDMLVGMVRGSVGHIRTR